MNRAPSKYRRHAIKTVISLAFALVFMLNSFSAMAAPTSQSYDDLRKMLDYSAVSGSYIAYREYPAEVPDEEIVLEAADFSAADQMEPVITENQSGEPGKSVLTGPKGVIEWQADIATEGYYNIEITYLGTGTSGADIKRALIIDGKLPFIEAGYLNFKRVWKQSAGDFKKDSKGNDIRPEILEVDEWQTAPLEDARGYVSEPFQFFLTAGTHTFSLLSQSESMYIRKIRIYNQKAVQSYAEYQKAEHPVTSGQIIPIEAEKPSSTSAAMLYPVSDYSSPSVSPYDAKTDKLNTIGGPNWQEYGQWIEWTFEAKEEGYYQIAVYYQQSLVRGTYSARELSIDGAVPFTEMKSIAFKYDKDFKSMVLSDGQNPYRFYFGRGSHTIRMKVVLGELSELVYMAENSVAKLNEIYRGVLMMTGKKPDINRDYQIARAMPSLAENLAIQRDVLTELLDRLNKATGEKSDKEALILTLIDQLSKMADDVEIIPSLLDYFKINIGGLGTWILQAVNQPLLLDRMYVYSPDVELPEQKNGFFEKLFHSVKKLFYSFILDYDTLETQSGDVAVPLTVWIGTGRDQATTVRRLLESGGEGTEKFSVDLMLAKMETLLSAVLAGQGPDAAMQLGNDLPMNYGMRGAVLDLSQFPDFAEVKERFRPSAMEAFTFGNRVFALPETQTFYLQFYRKDILMQLGLSVPKTWNDVKKILPVLNKNYLDFGLMPTPPEMSYGMFLYQNGGSFYEKDGVRSALGSDIAIEAFRQWISFYTEYGFAREFDFVSRFRTGEMPLGVADYTVYNTLQVSAPEIAGLWGIGPVPGVLAADGSINNTIPSTGSSVVIMDSSKHHDAAWEFLKWWTDAKIQSGYGREMESLMGASARYPTANIEALKSLPWPTEDFEALSQQFENVRGVPQVPGGYFTSRHLNNAFYTVVVNAKIGARDALIDYVRYIDDEIANKRREFGLEDVS